MLLVVKRAQEELKVAVSVQNLPRRITAGFGERCNCGDADQEEIGKFQKASCETSVETRFP
jgi:hypothetical protein